MESAYRCWLHKQCAPLAGRLHSSAGGLRSAEQTVFLSASLCSPESMKDVQQWWDRPTNMIAHSKFGENGFTMFEADRKAQDGVATHHFLLPVYVVML